MKSRMSSEAWKWLIVKKQNPGPEGQELALDNKYVQVATPRTN